MRSRPREERILISQFTSQFWIPLAVDPSDSTLCGRMKKSLPGREERSLKEATSTFWKGRHVVENTQHRKEWFRLDLNSEHILADGHTFVASNVHTPPSIFLLETYISQPRCLDEKNPPDIVMGVDPNFTLMINISQFLRHNGHLMQLKLIRSMRLNSGTYAGTKGDTTVSVSYWI